MKTETEYNMIDSNRRHRSSWSRTISISSRPG